MRIRVQNELLFISVITALLIIVVTFLPFSALRIVLGLPLILFFPGYILLIALYPRENQLGGIDRVALSFGVSLAIVPLIGLILNYTPWGIQLYPILIAIAVFILATSLIAWYRRRRVPEVERFTISLTLNLAPWRGQSFVDRTLSVIVIVAILAATGVLGYVLAAPRIEEGFTEFYILGPEGKAEGYPEELVAGEETKVIVGIINREHETMSYRLEIRIDGVKSSEVGTIKLEHDEKWERTVSFTPVKGGDNQTVEFLLYKNGESEPCLEPIQLPVSVTE